MSLPAIIMWAVVLLVSVTAAWRNPTAAALVVAWMACGAISAYTGEPLPVWFYKYADLAVVAVIAAKLERTRADRTVLALYPLCWLFYLSGVSDYHLWWSLWAITLAQFLAVGWDDLPAIHRFAETVNGASAPSDDAYRRLAWARESG